MTSLGNLRSRLALAAVVPLIASGAVVGATTTSASAADRWTTVVSHAGGKVQLCKSLSNNLWTIKIRVDNRLSAHGHRGHLSYSSKTRSTAVAVWANGRKISSTNAIGRIPRYLPSGASLSTGIGHSNGDSGDKISISKIGYCGSSAAS